MNDQPTVPTTTDDAAPKLSQPKRARSPRGAARKARAPTVTTAPDASVRPDFAARFRSAGTVTAHVCPNGHGATLPVEPGHTWCPVCGRHYTVNAAT